MLEAFLGGKLSRSQENIEDLLTSTVFGSIRREDASLGLLPILKIATDICGNKPIENIESLSADYNSYLFWPFWEEQNGIASCEPDLVIRINVPGRKNILLLIEVKYHSALSSWSDGSDIVTNQLAKEWLHISQKAGDDHMPWLIFLTSDFYAPRQEVEDALSEIQNKYNEVENITTPNISWLSWRQLSELFITKYDDDIPPSLRDVSILLQRLGLTYFHGFGKYSDLYPISYTFTKPVVIFQWNFVKLSLPSWSFI